MRKKKYFAFVGLAICGIFTINFLRKRLPTKVLANPTLLPLNVLFNTSFDLQLHYSSDLQCANILYNPQKHAEYDLLPDLTTDKEVLMESQKGCNFLKNIYSFILEPNNFTQEEISNPIAYSVVVHTKLHQLLHLLSAIYAPQNVYCIHVDLKTNDMHVNGLKNVEKCLPNVFLTSRRENVIYRHYSRLKADFNCMEDLLNLPSKTYNWSYLINICGQDFPLYTNLEIVRQLKKLNGHNWISRFVDMSNEFKSRSKYVQKVQKGKLIPTYEKKNKPPFDMIVRKSLAYNVFSRVFLHWVLFESKKAKALREWSRDLDTSEEHYWGMLDVLKEAPGRTETFREEPITPYIVWLGERCKGFWRNFNCVFSVNDVPEILGQKMIFANKFDIAYDSFPLLCIRKWLDERRYGIKNPLNPPKTPRIV